MALSKAFKVRLQSSPCEELSKAWGSELCSCMILPIEMQEAPIVLWSLSAAHLGCMQVVVKQADVARRETCTLHGNSMRELQKHELPLSPTPLPEHCCSQSIVMGDLHCRSARKAGRFRSFSPAQTLMFVASIRFPTAVRLSTRSLWRTTRQKNNL